MQYEVEESLGIGRDYVRSRRCESRQSDSMAHCQLSASPDGNQDALITTICTNAKDMPIVFQCANCYAIVGDSVTWIGADSELRAVVLSQVSPKVVVDKALLTSQKGYDAGSVFHQIRCSKCDTVIGNYYKATPKCLDLVRDHYSLFASRLESYELSSLSSSDAHDGTSPTEPAVTEMRKMKTLIVETIRRVEALEAAAKRRDWGDQSKEARHSDDDECVYRRRDDDVEVTSTHKRRRR